MNTLLSRILGHSIPREYRYRTDYSSAMQLCIHREVPLLRTLLQPISRQEPYVLTKAISWTYLAFSTYIESWACRMLRRPPRIKQIKTSGARGAWLMHGIHRNEKIPRSLYVVAVEDDAPEITRVFSTVAMASARNRHRDSRIGIPFIVALLNKFTFSNPSTFFN